MLTVWNSIDLDLDLFILYLAVSERIAVYCSNVYIRWNNILYRNNELINYQSFCC